MPTTQRARGYSPTQGKADVDTNSTIGYKTYQFETGFRRMDGRKSCHFQDQIQRRNKSRRDFENGYQVPSEDNGASVS
ncbi:hypothetical protein TWF506_004707 [Arthrobotrys conoides]|uniref:Uncharacterized protein n=1 Tax=Arthrobotrys conoides TaxID=74498 RepID=A0AAN8N044_9PEZI